MARFRRAKYEMVHENCMHRFILDPLLPKTVYPKVMKIDLQAPFVTIDLAEE